MTEANGNLSKPYSQAPGMIGGRGEIFGENVYRKIGIYIYIYDN